GTIDFHTNIAIGVTIFIVLIGLYLIFFGEEERIVTKIKRIPEKVQKKDLSKVMQKLTEEEKLVLKIVQESEGSIFQSSLVEKTNMNKVKVTRILDRLEGLDVIERKRRGMTNMVILKH
ncbi:MAG: MarR family transcriptional regulator, partial [archaeon]|nr:MarR family transcriptional regulator [archaeon]